MPYRRGVKYFKSHGEEMVTTSLRIPKALKQQMEELAADNLRSFGAETIIAMREHIDSENRRQRQPSG